jgi:HEAT repeat protein
MGMFHRSRLLRGLPLIGLLAVSLATSCASEVDVEKLYVQSNSDDYEERVEARKTLNDLVRQGKADPFARGLRSENAETRVQSILYLLAVKNEAAKKALVGELELARRFNVFYNPVRLVPSANPIDSRVMIAHIVFLLGGDPGATEILGRTYGSEPDADARVGTLYALGALEDPKGEPTLRKALKDPEMKVVKAALEGLDHLQAQDVSATLLEGLADSNEKVRANCAAALAGFPGEKTSAALAGALQKDPSEPVRVAAIGSLAYAGGMDAFQIILNTLSSRDSSPAMKNRAASALQSLSNQNFGENASLWTRWYERSRGKVHP